jgi:antirestriction protein ArdC
MEPTNHPTWADLLHRAVNEPGTISAAYRQFHNFSLGNQLLTWSQAIERKIPLGPIATYNKWRELGRQVRRGEKGIVLCMPITVRKKVEGRDGTEQDQEFISRFVFKPHWFLIAQTDGAEIPPFQVPSWDKTRALAKLGIEEIPFDCTDGNVQGYARQRQIAINPVCPHPWKTLLHEVGHIVAGHTAEGDLNDSEITPRSLREVEAEAVAMLCCEALGLPGADLCRGYIQSWHGAGNPIPEKSAQKILRVADQILKAGREEVEMLS